MGDHIDRAAEVIARMTNEFGMVRDADYNVARALDDAGLLVTPEHDRQVAARALRGAAEDFATGGWHDAWMTDGVDDDVSAVRSTEKWLRDRAAQIERGERT